MLKRTSVNLWDDQKVRDALAANGRNNTFSLSAMNEGSYEVYTVADASGGPSKDVHDYATGRTGRRTTR
ncbi:cysteine hydrolase family protein [Paraburkholderia xenovorans]|uniref:hypothetical protein n=1 Tax=Paraburkholderia xenovorans TaxID=36873 RepID=UPI0038B75D98